MANIKNYLTNIKSAIFGREVRNSIHDAIEAINNESVNRLAEQDNQISNNTVKQNMLENKYNEQIKELANEAPQLPEIVDARRGFETLGKAMKQKIYHFDNLNDMKKCLNLEQLDVCETLGYYEKNDGGAGRYIIVNDNTLTDDGGSIININNGLKAMLITKNGTISPNQFGAKGDGVTDDTDSINKTYNYAKTYNITNIKFKRNSTYMVRGYEEGQAEGSTTGLLATTGIILPSNTITDLNYATIKVITNSRKNYNAFTIKEVSNVILKNGSILGDNDTHTNNGGEWGYGVSIRQGTNIKLENLYCTKCWGDGINITNNGNPLILNEDILVDNCICDDNRRQGMSIENGNNILVSNSQFINTGKTLHTNPSSGVDVEPLSENKVINLTFKNCKFIDNYNNGLILQNDVSYVKVLNCVFIGNKETTSLSHIAVLQAGHVTFMNNLFGDENNDFNSFQIRPSALCEFINNTFYNAICLISSYYLNNDNVKFINNNFYRSKTTTMYNGVIELAATTSENDNNTLIVENNNFKNISNDRELVILYILARASSKFKKLICKNNVFEDGSRAIQTSISMICENNNFITSISYPIYLLSNEIYQVTTVIKENIFEQCSYNSANVGLIYTGNANRNVSITDNILYRKPLNTNKTINDPQNTPTSFITSSSLVGGSQNERNVILEN